MPRYTVADLNDLAERAAPQMTLELRGKFAAFAARLGDGYTLRNRFLIWLQNPDATQVASHGAWRDHGRPVKSDGSARGKGLAILAPLRSARGGGKEGPRNAPGSAANGADDGEVAVTGMRVSYVFDISVTEPPANPADAVPVAESTSEPTVYEITAMLASCVKGGRRQTAEDAA